MRITDERLEYIRACLRLFTHDFSSADVRFLARTSFPCVVTFTKHLREVSDPERKQRHTLESLDELQDLIKSYVSLCTEETIFEIEDEAQGTLILTRPSEQ